MPKPVTFFSEGVKLAGDLYLPDGLARGEKRAGIVLCHGYTGVRNIYLPDNARVLVGLLRGPGGARHWGASSCHRLT
jgi:hypothetical protein